MEKSEGEKQIPKTCIEDENKAWEMAKAEHPDRIKAIDAKESLLPKSNIDMHLHNAELKGKKAGKIFEKEKLDESANMEMLNKAIMSTVDKIISNAMDNGECCIDLLPEYYYPSGLIPKDGILFPGFPDKAWEELSRRVGENKRFSLKSLNIQRSAQVKDEWKYGRRITLRYNTNENI